MSSQKVMDFCHNRGVDDRTTFISGLFMEEMAANVVEHGFTKDQKPHSVDIGVVLNNKVLRPHSDFTVIIMEN